MLDCTLKRVLSQSMNIFFRLQNYAFILGWQNSKSNFVVIGRATSECRECPLGTAEGWEWGEREVAFGCFSGTVCHACMQYDRMQMRAFGIIGRHNPCAFRDISEGDGAALSGERMARGCAFCEVEEGGRQPFAAPGAHCAKRESRPNFVRTNEKYRVCFATVSFFSYFCTLWQRTRY